MNLVGEWVVLAERVLHDSETDSLTLVSCIEQVVGVAFPSVHAGFATAARYRLDGPPPSEPVAVDFRLVRVSEIDGEGVVAEFPGTWAAGTTHARIWTSFQVLRLLRAERLLFRVDHRVAQQEWCAGPATSLDVLALPGDAGPPNNG